jgi:hypothetical protein
MRLRPRLILGALALAGAAACGAFVLRGPILRTVGSALVADDPLGPSDIIVVPVWAGEAGMLEAADLVQRGVASTVAIVPEPLKPADREILRRGVRYDPSAERMAVLLASLGVEHVVRVPSAEGTEAEGQALPSWCDANRFRSVVVISSPDHGRRLRRVLRREMNGHPTRLSVRSARFAAFDAGSWWQTRDGTRTAIMELEKLLLDVARHPFA